MIDKTIQDLFNDVRNDQRKIAAKIGRKAARDLEERIKLTEKKRKDQIEELSRYVLNSLPAAPATQQTDSSEIAAEIPE